MSNLGAHEQDRPCLAKPPTGGLAFSDFKGRSVLGPTYKMRPGKEDRIGPEGPLHILKSMSFPKGESAGVTLR